MKKCLNLQKKTDIRILYASLLEILTLMESSLLDKVILLLFQRNRYLYLM